VGGGARLAAGEEVTPQLVGESAKVAVLLFLAAIVQVSILARVDILGGTPDLLLVVLVCFALMHGSLAGAVGGFFAGLVVDTATLELLGLTSLLLTVAGYWIGRYGETTGRDRAHAPFVSVAVVTFLYALGALVVHFMLGENAPGARVLTDVWPAIVLNLLLAAPVYAVVQRLLKPLGWQDRTSEVQLLG
jgi:rod shape-determining protein MreD